MIHEVGKAGSRTEVRRGRPRGRPRPISLVPSPCIGVCVYSGEPGKMYCKGCNRTTIEISEWIIMTDQQKEAVLERINEQGR